MTQTYFVTPTAIGEAKLANAAALGTTISITQMGVGDGNGAVPTPVSTQTALVNEVRRAALNSLSIDPDNANQIIAEQVIPDDEGGFWIREIGLFDADGNLLFVGNCPPSYKPLLAEGSGRTQTVRMIIIVSDTSTVTLKIDPSVVLATRQYVDNQAAAKQPLDATLTALAALAGSANKLPYFTGNDALALADLSVFMRGLLADADLSTLLSNLGLSESRFPGVIGTSRNAKMNVDAASSTATFTADEVIVSESLGGRQSRIGAFNASINLATIGAGGMDTGAVPATGFIALYAICNPTTGSSALLAVNATGAVAPEVYGGANMPAGYTLSALLSVWRVESGKFVTGYQHGRQISFPQQMVLASSAAVPSYTSLGLSQFVPLNARAVSGLANPNVSGVGYNTNLTLAASSAGTGAIYVGCGGAAIVVSFSRLLLITAQTIYYTLAAGTDLQTSYVYITGYEI